MSFLCRHSSLSFSWSGEKEDAFCIKEVHEEEEEEEGWLYLYCPQPSDSPLLTSPRLAAAVAEAPVDSFMVRTAATEK